MVSDKLCCISLTLIFFFNDTATTEIYTLSLHDALPIWFHGPGRALAPARSFMPSRRTNASTSVGWPRSRRASVASPRSEEHTSELQSRQYLVCRLLLEKKKN